MYKRMHISECTQEYAIAEDIVSNYGAFMLRKGTYLNSYIIKKLKEFGIEYIQVFKRPIEMESLNYKIFEKKYEAVVDDIKQLSLELVRGKRIPYSKISKIASSIICEYETPEQVLKCIGKVRDIDDGTYYHSVNVAFYSMLIGGWLNLARDDIGTLVQAALLHDIGKGKLPQGLLNKKEKLTLKEFDEIKKHPIYGYKIVRYNSDIPEEVKETILMHHERENKSGYPLRASGIDISMYTKIVAVADVYDAMTSERAYKKAKTPFDAFEEFFVQCRGSLDLKVVNTLLYNLSRYYIGSKVLLNDGQAANVAYIPPQCIWKPIVDTGSDFLDLSREKNIYIKRMA